MKIRAAIIALGLLSLTSCHQRGGQNDTVAEPTPSQQKLLDAGWTVETPDEEMAEEYGIKPIYGIRDSPPPRPRKGAAPASSSRPSRSATG